MSASLILAILSGLIWSYLLLFNGWFWRVRLPDPCTGAIPAVAVRVVIPARNEAEGIGQAITSLLSQDYPGPLSIILVDDHSDDDTAAIARRAAQAIDASDRLTIVTGQDLPHGWTGKLWAVSQGIACANQTPADFYLLTDADIAHGRHNVRDLVHRALAEDRDLVSLMVRLHCETWPERALIPAFIFFFFMLYPPQKAADPTSSLAAAAGGCILIRPAALHRIGGIQAIRGALIDDCSLAHAVKSSGGRIRLDISDDTHSLRIYAGWGEIWSMIARTAFTQLHYSTLLLVGTLFGLILTYLVPPYLALFSQGISQYLAMITWIAMSFSFWPTIRFYRLSPVWTVALPLITLFYASATFGSALNYWRGRGGQWKGRSQAPHA